MACNIIGTIAVDRGCYTEQSGLLSSYFKLVRCGAFHHRAQKNQLKMFRKGHNFKNYPPSSHYCSWCICKKPYPCFNRREYIVSCHSTNTCSREDKMCSSKECCSNVSSGLTRLNDRARKDVAVLGIGFMKLDARAREDTEKIDGHMRKKAACFHHIATTAQSKLKNAADQHWSDGALEADLKRADSVARRRAMEDAFIALKFVKDIHDMMTNKLHRQPQKVGAFSINDMMGFITLEKNGKTLDLFGGEVSTDRIIAIQEAYRSMAFALSEADGIDYTDPEELELLVVTLIDLDAMDSKSSVLLLAECARSPDVSTRKALANALASAPSMWILGNAGMGALQRLAEDHNPAVAAAASKAINELKLQWELEEGDSLRFIVNQHLQVNDSDDADADDADADDDLSVEGE